MLHPYKRFAIGLLALGQAACATTAISTPETPDYERVENPHFASIGSATSAAEKDRQAILGMRGDYRVDFSFQETVPLQAGYERRQDKTTGGFETVIVVENTPSQIVLQHILVAPGGHVVKHWRQDWFYEAKNRFEFVADQRWEIRPIAADKIEKAWTQCVYEVSDAPRYCGTGRWKHKYGVSTWTSDRTWRPLPRREYTIRDDYNAINAENRHTVTSHGWTHEQDNTKVLRQEDKPATTLVREFGFNDYRTIQGYDFSPATDYWKKTSDYWSRVRSEWETRMADSQSLSLKTEVDGMPIIVATFGQAQSLIDASEDEVNEDQQRADIESVLNEWTESSRAN